MTLYRKTLPTLEARPTSDVVVSLEALSAHDQAARLKEEVEA